MDDLSLAHARNKDMVTSLLCVSYTNIFHLNSTLKQTGNSLLCVLDMCFQRQLLITIGDIGYYI